MADLLGVRIDTLKFGDPIYPAYQGRQGSEPKFRLTCGNFKLRNITIGQMLRSTNLFHFLHHKKSWDLGVRQCKDKCFVCTQDNAATAALRLLYRVPDVKCHRTW